MSNPRLPTLTFPVSSPKLRACFAREANSYTPIFGPATASPSGRRRLPAPRCGWIRNEVINAQVLRGMEKNTQRILDVIDRLPTYLHRIGREYSGVKGTGFYRAMQSGKYPYRMYCFSRV